LHSGGPAACCRHYAAVLAGTRGAIQQTVDGLNAALEIESRSSYVPSSPIGVRSRGHVTCGDARLNAARFKRLEMPIWMK
jgi:hypothetical protein